MLSGLKDRAFLFHQKLLLESSDAWFQKGCKKALFVLSLLWKSLACVKAFCFDVGVFRSYRLKVPIVSIGNIVAGGTGKTPLVIKLLDQTFVDKKIALLSRGYKAGVQREIITRPDQSIAVIDEPGLIRKRIPNIYCFLGKNRLRLAKIAEQNSMDLIVMDDGFQYRKLRKDIQILTMNGMDLFGQNYFLPRGFLRDHPKRLSKADLIVVNYVKDKSQYQKICLDLQKYSSAPIVGVYPILSFVKYADNEPSTPSKVGIFCGIANPKGFIKTLVEKGVKIVSTMILNDHEKIKEKALREFSKECKKKGADCIICTEKDLMSFPSNLKLPLVLAKMDLNISFGKEHWQLMIEKIQDRVNNAPLSRLAR